MLLRFKIKKNMNIIKLEINQYVTFNKLHGENSFINSIEIIFIFFQSLYLHHFLSYRIKNRHLSDPFLLTYGVSQDSCLVPAIFIAYISYLYEVFGNHVSSIGGFADDHQLYLSVDPSTEGLQS